jgi:hypothetical protein
MQKIINVAIPLDKCDGELVSFLPPIYNNIIQCGIFTRILYLMHQFTMKGVNIIIDLKYTHIERYFNKYKCLFNPLDNIDVLNKIQLIENTILNQPNFKKKLKTYKISEHMQVGSIKFFSNISHLNTSADNMRFVLKIAGVWENDAFCGLTYKFNYVNIMNN